MCQRLRIINLTAQVQHLRNQGMQRDFRKTGNFLGDFIVCILTWDPPKTLKLILSGALFGLVICLISWTFGRSVPVKKLGSSLTRWFFTRVRTTCLRLEVLQNSSVWALENFVTYARSCQTLSLPGWIGFASQAGCVGWGGAVHNPKAMGMSRGKNKLCGTYCKNMQWGRGGRVMAQPSVCFDLPHLFRGDGLPLTPVDYDLLICICQI